MSSRVQIAEKYERNGWPSVDRPDLRPPPGWSLELVNSLNLIHHHSLSPDGGRVAFVWERDGRSDIFVQALDGGWPQRITHDRARTIYWWDSAPRWSPDGRWLAFAMNGHVWVAPADGSSPAKSVTGFTAAAWGPVWMPDSQGLMVSAERDDTEREQAHILLLTDRDGAWPRLLAGASGGDNGQATPSPNGRYVAYVYQPFDDLNRWDLRLLDLSTGQTQILFGLPGEKAWSPRFTADSGRVLFLSQRSGYTELHSVRLDGEMGMQVTGLGADIGEFAPSPDGRRVALTIHRAGAVDLALLDLETGSVSDLHRGRGYFSAPHWSPNGSFLTVEYEDATTPADIYRVDATTGEMRQLTFSTPPALATLGRVTPEHTTYRSYDGRQIPALLYRPATPNGAAIVRPHGGPADQSTYQWDGLAQYLVAKGYTYLAPNFRGSTGYGHEFEQANYNDWGVGDTQDVLHGARFLHTLGTVDPTRIGILGSSYGGYMVACCLARDPDYLFACGVSKYGDANVYTSWAQCERTTRLYTEMMLGHPRTNWPTYLAASPIHETANVRAPVLLIHGLDDDVVPPQASEEWAEALRRHDKVFEYKTYAGEPHGFLRHETELDWQRRAVRFFDWYLRG